MKRYLLMVAIAAVLIMTAADAIWPAPQPLLIDGASITANPAAWPDNAALVLPAGGDWCDVNHPPVRPRFLGPMEPVIRDRPDHRQVANWRVMT